MSEHPAGDPASPISPGFPVSSCFRLQLDGQEGALLLISTLQKQTAQQTTRGSWILSGMTPPPADPSTGCLHRTTHWDGQSLDWQLLPRAGADLAGGLRGPRSDQHDAGTFTLALASFLLGSATPALAASLQNSAHSYPAGT